MTADIVYYGRYMGVRRRRIESTSGREETVLVFSLPNGRTAFLRERASVVQLTDGEEVFIVAEVPKDNSTAAIVRTADAVEVELARIAARPPREPVAHDHLRAVLTGVSEGVEGVPKDLDKADLATLLAAIQAYALYLEERAESRSGTGAQGAA